MRVPEGFVPVTPTRWRELCAALGASARLFELAHDGARIGWRRPLQWYVDPRGYRAVLGRWPDGYWPD